MHVSDTHYICMYQIRSIAYVCIRCAALHMHVSVTHYICMYQIRITYACFKYALHTYASDTHYICMYQITKHMILVFKDVHGEK